MRQLATLPRDQAHLLADHLLTLGVPTRLDDEPAGTVVWVCEEDHVPKARDELAAFQADPADPRYRAAPSEARAIRSRAARSEQEYQRKQEAFNERMADSDAPPTLRPMTLLLIVASVLVGIGTLFGEKRNDIFQALLIAPVKFVDGAIEWRWLNAITHDAELWRLVTPIFLHFGVLHLLFNMLMFATLGSEVERRMGGGAFLGFVVLTAVISNLAEYYVQFGVNVRDLISLQPNPLFGGMSGVLYGLFGYLWMRSLASDRPVRALAPQFVTIMLVWLVICILGLMGNVANTAHVVGLLVGVGVGKLASLGKR